MEIQSPPETWLLLNVARTFFMAITAYAVMKIVETYDGRQIYIHMHIIYIYINPFNFMLLISSPKAVTGEVGRWWLFKSSPSGLPMQLQNKVKIFMVLMIQ